MGTRLRRQVRQAAGVLSAAAQVKPGGVVCDDYRVIFGSGQALSAGIVSVVVTSSSLVSAVSGTAVRRARARTSRPR